MDNVAISEPCKLYSVHVLKIFTVVYQNRPKRLQLMRIFPTAQDLSRLCMSLGHGSDYSSETASDARWIWFVDLIHLTPTWDCHSFPLVCINFGTECIGWLNILLVFVTVEENCLLNFWWAAVIRSTTPYACERTLSVVCSLYFSLYTHLLSIFTLQPIDWSLKTNLHDQ